jgi:hypothetical protein
MSVEQREQGIYIYIYIYIYNKDGVFLYYYYSVWGRKKGKRKYGFDSCVVEV